MRMPRFYIEQPLAVGVSVNLPETTFRHAIQVLRLSVGESLMLFNGAEGDYVAELTSISKKAATVSISACLPVANESPIAITLAQAVIKPDKMDFALQKAVELGVNTIQPLITQRSVVRMNKEQAEKKVQHWQGIVQAACEQSGRITLPSVLAPLSLENWLQQTFQGTRLMLGIGDYPRLGELPVDLPTPFALVIGPEGGFTDEETEACLAAKVQGVSLGKRVLRAETATLAALALIQHRFGDL